ncbi:MAG: hypothetical protein ABR911_07690 [Syntrophales bacterium]
MASFFFGLRSLYMRQLRIINFKDKASLQEFGLYKGSSINEFDVPFHNILLTLEKNACTDIIVERNYIDKEYLDEYSFFYSTSFKNYGRFCTRLHFFHGNIAKHLGINHDQDFIFTASEKDSLQKSYLGFCVIRPTDRNRISHTVIKPHIDNPRDVFIKSQSNYLVNLNGTCLTATGMPFMQQDSQAGLCASTDLVMLSRYMHEVHKHRLCTSPEVTLIANKFLGSDRSFPNRGLTIYHMLSALSEMGYSPVVYSRVGVPASVNLEDIVYYYLESALPVILFIQARGCSHVCLAIGHDFKPNLPPRITRKSNILRNSDFIRHFIVHDDELGPYLHLPLLAKDIKTANFFPKFDSSVFRSSYTHPWSFENVQAAIVPVHRKVYLSGEEIESNVEKILSPLNHVFGLMVGNMQPDKKKLFEGVLSSGKLALRSFFLKSNDYKKWIADMPRVSAEIREFYLNAELPRFIWLTEMSDIDNLRKPNNKDHLILGEIISDSTAGAKSQYQFISIHLPSVFLDRELNNPTNPDHIAIYSINNDDPYQAYIR